MSTAKGTSAFSYHLDRQRFLSSGMDGYISKPVHSEELFEAIETVLSPP
jgi:DNA-binding NarL/FixJ family response regulator